MAVIFAGYSGQMSDMLDKVNPGLKSRVSDVIGFPDFSAGEARSCGGAARRKGLTLPAGAGADALTSWTRRLVAAPAWANGRDVETFVRRAAIECATRKTVTPEALDAALASVLALKGGNGPTMPSPPPPMASPFATADPLAQNAFNFDLKKAIETAKMDDDGDDDDEEVGEPIDFADALEEAIVELGYDADSDARAELAQKLKAAIDGTAPFPEELRAKVAEKTGADSAAVDAAMERRARPVLAAVTAAIAYEKERESELEELDDEERDEGRTGRGPRPPPPAGGRARQGLRGSARAAAGAAAGPALCTTTTRCSRGSEGVAWIAVKLMCDISRPSSFTPRIHLYQRQVPRRQRAVDRRQPTAADSKHASDDNATPDACLPTSVATPSFHITGMTGRCGERHLPVQGRVARDAPGELDRAHLTSPDLARTRTPSALSPNGDWDGTLSMLGGKPIIFFDCYSVEDCNGSYVPPARRQRQRSIGLPLDPPIVGVARPSDPDDAALLSWKKDRAAISLHQTDGSPVTRVPGRPTCGGRRQRAHVCVQLGGSIARFESDEASLQLDARRPRLLRARRPRRPRRLRPRLFRAADVWRRRRRRAVHALAGQPVGGRHVAGTQYVVLGRYGADGTFANVSAPADRVEQSGRLRHYAVHGRTLHPSLVVQRRRLVPDRAARAHLPTRPSRARPDARPARQRARDPPQRQPRRAHGLRRRRPPARRLRHDVDDLRPRGRADAPRRGSATVALLAAARPSPRCCSRSTRRRSRATTAA